MTVTADKQHRQGDDSSTCACSVSMRSTGSSLGCSCSSASPQATERRSVSFRNTVRVREHERILSDDPCSRYAGFALGWEYNEARENYAQLNDSTAATRKHEKTRNDQVDESDDRKASRRDNSNKETKLTRRRPSSSSSSSSMSCSTKTARSDCWAFIAKNGGAGADGQCKAVRYTASERMKILCGYGFSVPEIVKQEKIKTYERKAQGCFVCEQAKKFRAKTLHRENKKKKKNNRMTTTGNDDQSSPPSKNKLMSSWFRKRVLPHRNTTTTTAGGAARM